MSSKSSNHNKTMIDLNEEIELHKMLLADYSKNDDNNLFIKQMDDFRNFLKEACKLSSGYLQLFNQFKEQEAFHKYKDFFTFCESFHERLIEIHEKENILKSSNNFSSIGEYLSLEYNKKFYQDISNEFNKLDKYMKDSKNFIMIGCGSFPITLFSVCEKYKQLNTIGIDSSPEAIINAKELKGKLKYKNVIFEIVDGINYNYINMDTIFIANLVIPKTKVLKRIAMTSKPGTKILLRVPVMYGSLLSEDAVHSQLLYSLYAKNINN